MKFFGEIAICTLRESDELEELCCVDCKDYEDFAAEEYYCIGCKKKKPFNTFLACARKKITQGRHGYTKLFCGDCQFPPCKVCGKQAEEAVTGTQRQAGYYCGTCGWKKKPKLCKNEACKGIQTLECYPEKAQAMVMKNRRIANRTHLCSHCKKIGQWSALGLSSCSRLRCHCACSDRRPASSVDWRDGHL